MRSLHKQLFLLFFILNLAWPLYGVERSIFNTLSKGHFITQSLNDGYIDWTAGYVSARATVRLPRIIFDPKHPDYNQPGTAFSITDARAVSREKAREEAELKLMQIILSMQLDSETAVRKKMEEDLSFRDRMGFVSSKFVTKSEKSGNGIVSIEMAIPFTGNNGLYSIITGNYYNTETIPEFPESIIRQEISGIIIDLTEFKEYKPSLEPRIFTDQGRMIYGPETLHQKIAVQRGIVSYQTDHEKARQDYRSGLSPYYLYASSVQKGNIYLDSEEVKRILSSPAGKKAFQFGKIVLLLAN